MGPQPAGHHRSFSLDTDAALAAAEILRALANPTRLRIVAALQQGPTTVGRLTATLAMEQSAVSHHLRVLRDQGFVTTQRDGRHIEYSLHDNHVGELIEQALSHAEHVRLQFRERETVSTGLTAASRNQRPTAGTRTHRGHSGNHPAQSS